MDNKKLYEKAEESVEDLFADSSVSQEKCKANLENLRDLIEMKIDSLGDIESEE